MSGSVAVGFFGKLPARGDFVRVGLPRAFTDPWDDWLQTVMAGSRALAGERWLPAFLQAPVWRFCLPPGMCGPGGALGLMLPSVDRAGRYYPLVFAALSPSAIAAASGAAWLDACETAGRAALEQDTSPAAIAAALQTPQLTLATTGADEAVWWGDDSASPACIRLRRLPDAAQFAAMLGVDIKGADVAADGTGPEEETWSSTS